VLVNRRNFLRVAAVGALAASVTARSPAQAVQPLAIKAVAFDGFAVFDPRPIFALTEELFPGKGAELSSAWRTRQFEYTWLRTSIGRYRDFWHVTEDALVFSARLLKLELNAQKRDRLMQAYLEINAWPDAQPVLQSLKAAGIRMALLANLTREMMDAGVRNSGLEDLFEPHLSTDRVQAFKPAPRAYQMGVDAFGLRRDEIAFAAFGGWDAAGAKAFGYATYWVNRANAPLEELSLSPDATGNDLRGLESFCRAR